MLKVETETNLHYKVVQYIRKYDANAILMAELGENPNTVYKRIDSWRKGYQKGAPDLIIANNHQPFVWSSNHQVMIIQYQLGK